MLTDIAANLQVPLVQLKIFLVFSSTGSAVRSCYYCAETYAYITEHKCVEGPNLSVRLRPMIGIDSFRTA